MAVLSFFGYKKQQQKDEAQAPHLWLGLGAIKRYGGPVFLFLNWDDGQQLEDLG